MEDALFLFWLDEVRNGEFFNYGRPGLDGPIKSPSPRSDYIYALANENKDRRKPNE